MRDKAQRPIIHFNLRQAIDAGFSNVDDFIDIFDAVMNYSIMHAIVPGQIETFTFLMDAQEVPIYEFPVA